MTARFDVRRAELDARVDKDLVSANDFARRQLALEQAKQQLTRLETDARTRLETDRAALTLVEEGRAKAALAMDRAKKNIDSLVVRAPIDGMVVVRQNYDAAGGMFFSGMTLPELRAGDNTFAGRQLVDVYDLTGMQLRVKVNELARANVAVGQVAEVISDGLPGAVFKAKVSHGRRQRRHVRMVGFIGPLAPVRRLAHARTRRTPACVPARRSASC